MHRVYTLFLLFFCCSSVGQQIDFRVGPYRDQPEERSQRSYHTNKINTVKKNISDNSGNFYPDYGSSDHGYTLFNNHRQCARWNVADYWLGLIQMHGQYIPIGSFTRWVRTNNGTYRKLRYLFTSSCVHTGDASTGVV